MKEDDIDTSETSYDTSVIPLMKKDHSYPEQSDPDLQYYLYKKKEFYNNRTPERPIFTTYAEIKNYRDNIGCAHLNDNIIISHPYQTLLTHFINPSTPYKGIIIMHGLGSGKTRTGVEIAEGFIPQCQKYRSKIYILISGPLLKESWKEEIIKTTGEKYIGYYDKSMIINDADKEKMMNTAMSLILQYYKFMSYKSFHKHVLGEKIIDKSVAENDIKKIKNVYKKNEEGEFERDMAKDRIYNLNNSLLIVDEAHQLTGNAYGEAVKYIIDNSINLKIVLMSGTPMKNFGHDIIDLINFLRPIDYPIERDKVFTHHRNYLMDFKEGGEQYFKKMASGYFSYVKGADPITYAVRNDQGEIPPGLFFTKVTRCKMNEFQKKIYDQTINDETDTDIDEEKTEDTLDRKSEAISNVVFPGLSADKKNIVGYYGLEGITTIKNQLKENYTLINKKLSEMLFQHDNETDLLYFSENSKTLSGKIFREDNLINFSTKFHRALQNINNLVWGKDGPKTVFVYSNLVKVGIEIFQEILLQNGYLEYQEKSQNYQINSDTICYYCGIKHNKHSTISRYYTENKVLSESTDNNIPIHAFHPAVFLTITGQTSDDTIETIPTEKKKILKNVFNDTQNYEGKRLKIILGSRIMNEGINLFHVGEVHILDVYYNLGKVDQAVGRGIRLCSHYKLMTEQNPNPEVKVYKYVVTLDNNKLSIEEILYKKAELKYILIKKVERLIKEIAIDCPHNINGNIFKEEVEKYKNCEKEGSFQCPVSCDFMNCEYKCANEKLNTKYYDPSRKIYKTILKEDLDNSTFNNELARNEIEAIKGKIKDLYIMNVTYAVDDIIKYIKDSYEGDKKDFYDEFFVLKALDELVPISENDFNNFKDTIIDKYNRQGYLIYRGKYYIFQEFNDIHENSPMYYRRNFNKKMMLNLSIYNYLKMNNKLQIGTDNKKDSGYSYYDFDSIMDYYDDRPEYNFVGIIDKNADGDSDDVFKLREKRAKILDKKRATGLPSFKGAVCVNAKSKGYLQDLAKKLNVITEKTITRTNICHKIKNAMLLLEKYSTKKDKNKFTYVIIPYNHPKLPFPYNLEDRIDYITNILKKNIKISLDINTTQTKKPSGPEKGYPSYIITIKTKDKNPIDANNIETIVKRYNGKIRDNEYEIVVD